MKSAPVLFCILWACIIGLVLWLFDMAYGWFAPFWCWVTDYQTLVGAIIAGAMTLGGGFLAYSAGMKAVESTEKIYKETKLTEKHAAIIRIQNFAANIESITQMSKSNLQHEVNRFIRINHIDEKYITECKIDDSRKIEINDSVFLSIDDALRYKIAIIIQLIDTINFFQNATMTVIRISKDVDHEFDLTKEIINHSIEKLIYALDDCSKRCKEIQEICIIYITSMRNR